MPVADYIQRIRAINAAAADAADMRRRMGAAAVDMDAASDGSWQARWRQWPDARHSKTADMTRVLTTASLRHVPAHLVRAHHDSIVPGGRLRVAPSASARVVPGTRGWMLANRQDFSDTARRVLAWAA